MHHSFPGTKQGIPQPPWTVSSWLQNYQSKIYFDKGDDIKQKATVLGSKNKTADIIVQDKLVVFGKKGENFGDLVIEIDKNIKAPLKQGDVLGKAYVKQNDKIIAQTNLISKYDVEKSGFFDNVKEFITNW